MQFRLLTLLVLVAVAAVLTVLFTPAPDKTPQLFKHSNVDSASIANAVNYYVSIGEEKAIRELGALSAMDLGPLDWFELNMRIGWVCRILFTPSDSDSLRPFPGGGLLIPYDTMPSDEWPLIPIVKSNETFAVLSRECVCSGEPPNAREHLRYCSANGEFRTEPVAVPSKKKAIADLEKLRTSQRWCNILWSGQSYSLSEDKTWRTIIAQAEAVPE